MANRIIRGPSITVGEREFNLPLIMDELQISMDDDPEDVTEISHGMLQSYALLSPDQRTSYNQALIDVCGYGMRSLLLAAAAEDDLLLALDFELPKEDTDDDSDLDDAP